MTKKILLSHREALELLSPNFTDSQLRRLARAGQVPGYRPPVRRGTRGGKAEYERARLEAWLAQGLPRVAAAGAMPPLATAPHVPVQLNSPGTGAQFSGDHRRFGRFRRSMA